MPSKEERGMTIFIMVCGHRMIQRLLSKQLFLRNIKMVTYNKYKNCRSTKSFLFGIDEHSSSPMLNIL